MSYGFVLPFSRATGSIEYFEMTNTRLEAKKQDCISLLMTNWGERVMMFNFGCNLREFLFEQKSKDIKQRIADRIISQFAAWEPDVVIDILNIFIGDLDENIQGNRIRIKLFCFLRNDRSRSFVIDETIA